MLQVETAIGVGADNLQGLRYPAEGSLVGVVLTTGRGTRAESVGQRNPTSPICSRNSTSERSWPSR